MSKAVLYVNLGSPDSPAESDVRRYLNQFLMDPLVLDTPWVIRRFVVSALILPKRPKTSGEAYETIWTNEGSPLVTITRTLIEKLRGEVDLPIYWAMRYGNPGIEQVIKLIRRDLPALTELLLIPAYPHYAQASVQTSVEAVQTALKSTLPCVRLTVQAPFYNDPDYIDGLAQLVRPTLSEPFDHLLLSYHGLPERHIRKADPTGNSCLAAAQCCALDPARAEVHRTCYRHQAFETTRLLAERLELQPDQYSISFQSRFGRDPWLLPETESHLADLLSKGKKRMLVFCPAFVADCLETLEEINERARDSFLSRGGLSFTPIVSLNTHPQWVATLAKFVRQFAQC